MFKKLYLLSSLYASLLSFGTWAQCPDVTASFTPSQTDICGPGGVTINFVNTSAGANAATADYEWFLNGASFDNTTGLGAPNGSNIGAIGTYTYMLVATDPSVPCTDTAIVQVNIYPTPNASFTFAPDNVCAGTNINFNNTSTGTQGSTTFNWNFGDGGTSTQEDPTYAYGAGGTFNASLTVTNGPGCTSTANQTVTALDIPNACITGDDGDGDLINCLLPADPSTSETVTFSNCTTGGVSYEWDFGDGSPLFTTASTADFTHDYTSFGTYTVTMTATHANGCTSTETLTVVFEKYVSASMTLDITEYSGCTPHTMSTLTNLSVNANSYIWDFGDGTVITTTSHTPPPHAYATDGTYTISLTAINSCNQANATISPIVIIAGPTAGFNTNLPLGGGTMGCASQNMDVANTSQDAQPANNYYWDMGNGNTYANTTTPPTQTYDTAGVYTVMLVAGNACGPDTMLLDITIDTIPVADITSIPIDGCSPLTVVTTNNSYSDPLNYQWFVDGVNAGNAQALPDQIFTNTGATAPVNHTIQLNVSNICGNDTDQETIIVHPETEAIFTISDDTICVGESITFTDGSFGEALSWEWDFGVQTESTQGPHIITYNAVGNYTVELIVDGFCGPDTMTIDIVVLPFPIADFTTDITSGCVDFDVAITNNSTVGGTYNWTMTGATPATSNLYNPGTINYAFAGAYQIILDVDVLGCAASDTVDIDANPLPVPSFNLLPVDGCTPLDVALTNTSPNNPGDDFDWDLGNGNTFNGQNPANETYVAASNDSIYTIQLIITTADGCVDSVESNVTVHPLPIADYTVVPDTACAGDPIAFLNNSTGASTYQWDFGDGNTSSVTSPSNTYAITGDIITQLVAITAFGCTDTMQIPVYVDSIPTADFNFDIVCDIDTTQFTDLSIGGPTNWDWDFGDGNTSTDQNPAHFYGAAGTYNVILTVTNPAGCANTINQLVDVSLVPIADFSTNPTCLGSAAQFTDLTSGIPTSWEWDFGDGSPVDNNQNPTHIYGATGNYNVTLIAAAGNGCSDTTTLPITVTPIPTADFSFLEVCTNDTTFFTDLSLGAPDTWFWDFGDGTTDNTNNPFPDHIYTTAGAYDVMLVAGYSASGCTDTLIQTVNANPLTTPDFTTNTPCLGGATNFTDITGGAPIQWEWDFGDGATSIQQNPTHVYGTDGTFNVELVTENIFGCSDTFLTSVTVYPLPTADFTSNTVCLNATTNFTDLSIGAVAWEWNFGDGSPLDNNQNPAHVYSASGNFNVQLVVTNSDGCTDTIVQGITVNPNPIADFTAATACHTYPTQFTDLSTDAVNYYWDFGDGSAVNNNADPVYTYVDPGAYTVEMIVENVFGCTDTFTQLIDVLIQPQAGFTNNTVCAGESVTFTDTSTNAPTTWAWDFGDGSAVNNNQHPTHTFNPGGVYDITLIVGNPAGCVDTVVVPIDVYTVPQPDFLADTVCLFSITTFTDQTIDAVPLASWAWDFDDGNTSPDQNPTYIFQAAGQYNVQLVTTNVNGCTDSITIPVFVSDIPVANFFTDTVCLGNPTTFTDISTGFPNEWFWTFGDGNSDNTGPVTTHTYAGPGSYIASLLVTAGGVCQDQAFGVVEVIDNVTAGITLASDSICDGNAFNFIDNSTITIGNITGYFWDFGDGNSAATEDATHQYAAPGTYTVTHTVDTDGGCSNTVIIEVTVMPNPVAAFQDLAACQNAATSFSDLSTINGGGNITQWTWDFGDGTPPVTSQDPTHVFAGTGNYDVTLTVTSDLGCSSSVVIPTVVYPAPIADFTSPLSCPEDTVQYTDQSVISSGTIVNWEWDFGDGTGSTTQNPEHTFQSEGDNFDVTLVVTSNFGCTDTVMINTPTYPYPTFQYGPEWASGCQPLTVQFNDSSVVTGGIITNWEWDFGDSTMSFAQNPIHIFNEDGTYYVGLTVTTSMGCSFSDTLLYPVIVYPKPVAGFTPLHTELSILEPEIQFYDQSFGALDYEWHFGDGNYSNDVNPTHEYTDTGYYQVMQIVYTEFGCSDTAINTVNVYGEFMIYVPNAFTPNGDHKNPSFRAYGLDIERFDMWIFNRWGEEIWHADDIETSWDGTYQGHVVQDDVYVWKVICFDSSGKEHEFYGHVTVIK